MDIIELQTPLLQTLIFRKPRTKQSATERTEVDMRAHAFYALWCWSRSLWHPNTALPQSDPKVQARWNLEKILKAPRSCALVWSP